MVKVPKDLKRANWLQGTALLVFALAIALTGRGMVNVIEKQHGERECWFERTADVDEIQARIGVVTGKIFVAAIQSPSSGQEPDPALIALSQELDALVRELGPAIERQADAIGDC